MASMIAALRLVPRHGNRRPPLRRAAHRRRRDAWCSAACCVALAYWLAGQASLAFGDAAVRQRRCGCRWAWRWPPGCVGGPPRCWAGAGGLRLAASPALSAPAVLSMVAADLIGAALCAACARPRRFRSPSAAPWRHRAAVGAGALAALAGAAIVAAGVAPGFGLREPAAWPQRGLVGSVGRWIGLLLAGRAAADAGPRGCCPHAGGATRRRATLSAAGRLLVVTACRLRVACARVPLPLVLAMASCRAAGGAGGARWRRFGVGHGAARWRWARAGASGSGRGPFAAALQAQLPAALWAYAAALVGIVLLVHLLTRHTLSVEQRWLTGTGWRRTGRRPNGNCRPTAGRTSTHWQRLAGTHSTALRAWVDSVHADDRPALLEALRQTAFGRAQSRAVRAAGAGRWWLALAGCAAAGGRARPPRAGAAPDRHACPTAANGTMRRSASGCRRACSSTCTKAC